MAALCLKKAIENSGTYLRVELDNILTKTIKLISSETCLSRPVIASCFAAMYEVGNEIMSPYSENVVSSLLSTLECKDWSTRKASAEALGAIVQHPNTINDNHISAVITALDRARFDKMKPTREAVAVALKSYRDLQSERARNQAPAPQNVNDKVVADPSENIPKEVLQKAPLPTDVEEKPKTLPQEQTRPKSTPMNESLSSMPKDSIAHTPPLQDLVSMGKHTRDMESINSQLKILVNQQKSLMNTVQQLQSSIFAAFEQLDSRISSVETSLQNQTMASQMRAYEQAPPPSPHRTAPNQPVLLDTQDVYHPKGLTIEPHRVWSTSLAFLNQNQIDAAISTVLASGDQLHLARLLNKCEPTYNGLSSTTCKELFLKLMDMLEEKTFLETVIPWIGKAVEEGFAFSAALRADLIRLLSVISRSSSAYAEEAQYIMQELSA
eukprot:TRINITY_DN6451_c0_g1_i3.p1 TRINITY_DN6451_c0_g1~~TRINITY_DN6451_c0_g1_i3.p1  ORF type:complete len:439 (-),score=83.89 TRINITY_DN6451_c0_g1_i3:297-1613(-)